MKKYVMHSPETKRKCIDLVYLYILIKKIKNHHNTLGESNRLKNSSPFFSSSREKSEEMDGVWT